MIRIKTAWLAVLLALTVLPAWAAGDIAATVAKITGKAQIQKGANWVALTLGQKLATGDTISTGFRSELQLQIGASVVVVKPLSTSKSARSMPK